MRLGNYKENHFRSPSFLVADLGGLGVRAMVRSTFDRSGANEAADSSHYLYYNRSTGAARAVAMSLEGTRGCLYFCRFNHV